MLATLSLKPAACRPRVARRTVVVQAQAAPRDFQCPLLQEQAACQGKTSCVHPGRPVSQACGDCPRKAGRAVAMAKSKCVHPNRPLSSACADCPRRK